MEWIKEGLKLLISRSDKEQKEFEKYNSLLVLSRIRLISFATIFLSVFWAYMDWVIINKGAGRTYTTTLLVMHIISEAASVAFLIFYHQVTVKEKKNYRNILLVLKIYVFLYILFGALSSINSQRYTGNIYTYIILLLIAAVAFTLKPSFMLWAFGVNHTVFFVGLGILCKDADQFLTKMVNATVFAGAAYLLGFIFYRHRMLEYLYQKQLKENEENFKKLFYMSPYPVFITRLKDGKIIEASERACTLMEIDAKGLEGFDSADWNIKNESLLALWDELEEHNSIYDRIVEYNFKGKQMWVTANYELIDYRGEKCALTGIMDITEIRKAEEELSHYAFIDSLTGILNRRMGLKKLEELIEEARENSLEFVLCFLDINDLKYVNDTYGHGEGDRYILTFCDIIKDTLEEEDIFFRMGGDEFIIVFKNKNKYQAENVWNELVVRFDEKNLQREFAYDIVVSHGLFYYRTGMDINLDEMIEKADKLMYKEKQNLKRNMK